MTSTFMRVATAIGLSAATMLGGGLAAHAHPVVADVAASAPASGSLLDRWPVPCRPRPVGDGLVGPAVCWPPVPLPCEPAGPAPGGIGDRLPLRCPRPWPLPWPDFTVQIP